MLRVGIDLRELRRPGTGIGRWALNALAARRTLAPEIEFVALGAGHPDAAVSLVGPSGPWIGPSLNPMLKRERIGIWLSPYFKIPPFLDIPAICTVHDTIPATIWYRKVPFTLALRHALKVADRVATVSEISRRDLEENWHVAPDRILLARNAVDEHFSPVSEADDARILLSYGLVSRGYLLVVSDDRPHKNVQTLVDAFAGRDLPPVVVVGTRRTDLPAPLRRLDVAGDESLAVLYRHARVLLHPARQEGFGLPPLEAMASGTPVIVSDIPVMHEIAGDSARYVAPDDIEGWRTAVATELASELRSDIALAAAARFRGDATYADLWAYVRHKLAS